MNTERPKVLLVDDQWGQADYPVIGERYGLLPVAWKLESAESASGVYSSKKALDRIRKEKPSAVLLDIMFGRNQPRLGVEILESIRAQFPLLPVIIFTSLESKKDRELVVRCMELGANEYLEKAPNAEHMRSVLNVYTGVETDNAIYGNSLGIRRLRADVARAAFSGKTSILISGESGTGKELVAKALHRQGPSPRRGKPFVAFNCAYQDSQLLESELFGHKKGAFTGALDNREGLLQQADGGVLFLDEVASMPLPLQGKLLRALDTKTFRRLGDNQILSSDFQLLCAINQPAEQLLEEKKLREDFYYRIAAFTVHVPALRERREDIPILAELFLKRFKEDQGYAAHRGETFSSDALRQLQLHNWRGNVRELKNAVERSLILSTDAELQVENLSNAGTATAPAVALKADVVLPDGTAAWDEKRLLSEIKLALCAKKHIQTYKGRQWKAEFMRLVYPNYKAANAKGLRDLIKRLTQGQGGCPRWEKNAELADLIRQLED